MTDGNPLGLEDPSGPEPLNPRRWLGLFGFVLLSLAMLATVFVVTAAGEKKASLLQAEHRRLQESVLGRAKILETWLAGRLTASRRLTDSHVMRLFVTDLAAQKRLSPLPRSLQDQRPYFHQLMVDFARQNDLVRATVLRADGAVLLGTPGPALPVTGLIEDFRRAGGERDMSISAIRHVEDRDGPMVVDLVTAFPPAQTDPQAQTDGGSAQGPAAMLVLTLPVASVLEEILSSRAGETDGERISLLQRRGDAVEALRMERGQVEFVEDRLPQGVLPGLSAAFARRNDGADIYSIAGSIDGLPWSVHHAIDARTALAPAGDFVKSAIGLSILAVIALTSAFGALWWRQGRNHHRHLVDLYKTHADRSERQRRFMQSVTASMTDWLAVSSPEGDIVYTNPAFDAVIGSTERSARNAAWNELVKHPATDERSEGGFADLIDASGTDIVDIGGIRYLISSSVTDLRADDGRVLGSVRVIRDHTELASERRRRLQAATQTVDAFVRAIELRDPFLLGHTERVRTHAIAIGGRLGLSEHELASLALAASLSQIGKIFIPDEVLAKPDRHSPEEVDIMRDHILHAAEILRKIDFDLPIADTVIQMHERLDGSGYPHGLAGDSISLAARILGIADVFCARTAPRSYRDRISAGKTLYHLADNGRRYDLRVVAALADIVDQGADGGDLDMDDGRFPDAAIWKARRRSADSVPDVALSS